MTRRTVALLSLAAGGLLAARAWRRVKDPHDFENKTVVILGGSRGLGLVMAREFASEGARVVIAARDRSELERAREDLAERGARVSTIVCDVRDRRQVDDAVERIVAGHGTIDVLVNNAGVIQVGPFAHMDVGDFEDAMATHFWGPLFAVLAALPHMRRAGMRRIVNISSVGGRIAVPHLLPYSASKFALTGLSEGLQAELAREGIHVTTVWPGLMRTGSTYNARFKGRHRLEFAWFHTAGSLPGLSIDARRAARQIVQACRRGDATLTITPPARLAELVHAGAPRTMARLMSLTNRFLPSAAPERGAEAWPGWDSMSRLVPSPMTRLADRATRDNNERPAIASR